MISAAGGAIRCSPSDRRRESSPTLLLSGVAAAVNPVSQWVRCDATVFHSDRDAKEYSRTVPFS